MAHPAPTRGQLLRTILRTAKELRALDASTVAGRSEINAALVTKAELQARIIETEGELAELRSQHAYESANDRDLVQLQRVNNIMAMRKQELVRATMAARTERDKCVPCVPCTAYYVRFSTPRCCRCKADQCSAYYGRIGAALEQQRLLADDAPLVIAPLAPPSAAPPPELRQLRADAEALWRRASSASVAVKDMLHASLAFSGGGACGEPAPLHPLFTDADVGKSDARAIPWMPSAAAAGASLLSDATTDCAPHSDMPGGGGSGGGGGATPAPAVATAPAYLAYASLGPSALLADATRALDAASATATEAAALQRSAEASLSGQGVAGETPIPSHLRAQLALLLQHVALQVQVLGYVRDIAEGLAGSGDAAAGGDARAALEASERA